MNTPRPRSPPLFKPTTHPPPPLLSPATTTSPSSRDFDFSFSCYLPSSPPSAADMSRTPPLGRVGSDLSHNNYAKASHHHHQASGGGKDRDKAKNKASSPFFSGLGGSWRSGESRDTAGKAEEVKRKARARRGLDVGQWVKKYMASMVEHLLASFSGRHGGERDRREQQRRRPHSFSVHGPSALREQRERWRRRRGQLSSAPASLRASPTNSGHLSVGGSVKVSTSSEESTMEELQSAIEAAIAHCKNSIAVAK
ncbi:probable BRI1 kinase inhibitor 1 [Oryza brachyantha]|uniref:probable BRI1 kinase inhibitor 1 n=1 Tax=Oryza brachyantha TaxID=4533 RepID=UPI001ADA7710|nr:probable BRI1 kinase inhibitor 1 [Oryza brachyantha]